AHSCPLLFLIRRPASERANRQRCCDGGPARQRARAAASAVAAPPRLAGGRTQGRRQAVCYGVGGPARRRTSDGKRLCGRTSSAGVRSPKAAAKPTLPVPGEGRWRDKLQGGARTAVNRRGPEETGELRQA
ncbi:Os01g0726001, partial [Oryza sativa Japonica Group]